MVERKYSSDSAISQTGRAFTDKIDTNPKNVNSSCKDFEAKGHGVQRLNSKLFRLFGAAAPKYLYEEVIQPQNK
jgi:hypothetical protein